eukprot:2751038-Pyramimonas_sp.AAC.1
MRRASFARGTARLPAHLFRTRAGRRSGPVPLSCLRLLKIAQADLVRIMLGPHPSGEIKAVNWAPAINRQP